MEIRGTLTVREAQELFFLLVAPSEPVEVEHSFGSSINKAYQVAKEYGADSAFARNLIADDRDWRIIVHKQFRSGMFVSRFVLTSDFCVWDPEYVPMRWLEDVTNEILRPMNPNNTGSRSDWEHAAMIKLGKTARHEYFVVTKPESVTRAIWHSRSGDNFLVFDKNGEGWAYSGKVAEGVAGLVNKARRMAAELREEMQRYGDKFSSMEAIPNFVCQFCGATDVTTVWGQEVYGDFDFRIYLCPKCQEFEQHYGDLMVQAFKAMDQFEAIDQANQVLRRRVKELESGQTMRELRAERYDLVKLALDMYYLFCAEDARPNRLMGESVRAQAEERGMKSARDWFLSFAHTILHRGDWGYGGRNPWLI